MMKYTQLCPLVKTLPAWRGAWHVAYFILLLGSIFHEMKSEEQNAETQTLPSSDYVNALR